MYDALRDLGRTIQQKKVNYVVEATSRDFQPCEHKWMMKFLGVRVGDKRLLRLIWRMLRGGVMEDGLTKGERRRDTAGWEPIAAAVETSTCTPRWTSGSRTLPQTVPRGSLFLCLLMIFSLLRQIKEDAEGPFEELSTRSGWGSFTWR